MRIRPVKPEDAAAINRINENVQTQNIFSNIASHHFDDAEKLIANLTQFDHMLVLETETPPLELCAAALLRVNPQIYRRRMATLRIIVDKKWQGQGLGKALAAAATDLADNELMIERVEV
ncbi:MAG TPA: GNAT family N-acetyltransferase, partial [Candidatus Caccocola faecipullorum]|nr:GNAT family N-acetyltransferase [Candidatus Caccocola faecipullorum]